MLLLVVAFLFLVLWIGRKTRGPLWAMAIAWLVSIAPIATGAINYSFLAESDLSFSINVIAYLLCFVFGVLAHDIRKPRIAQLPMQMANEQAYIDFRNTMPTAAICWWIGLAGIAFLMLDFFLERGAGLEDLAAVRYNYINRSASIYAQLASIFTWACLYCFAFTLTYRDRLGLVAFIVLLLPVVSYFSVALFSAGRQATFHIMIFAVLLFLLNRTRKKAIWSASVFRISGYSVTWDAIIALVVAVTMIGYMGYIATARDDIPILDDRVKTLSHFFSFTISPFFESFLDQLNADVRITLMEAVVYFSSPVALFSPFMEVDFTPTYGAMTFPFVYRQIEPITGISVLEALRTKMDLMESAGVIGAGWTTGISSYVIDFGVVGAAVFLFAQGYYSAYTWRRALSGASFHEDVIAIVMLASAIYLPLVVASSDTNLFLLWSFCFLAHRRRINLERAQRNTRARNDMAIQQIGAK